MNLVLRLWGSGSREKPKTPKQFKTSCHSQQSCGLLLPVFECGLHMFSHLFLKHLSSINCVSKPEDMILNQVQSHREENSIIMIIKCHLALLKCQPFSTCFPHVPLFNLYNTIKQVLFLCPFYRWGLEGLHNVDKDPSWSAKEPSTLLLSRG